MTKYRAADLPQKKQKGEGHHALLPNFQKMRLRKIQSIFAKRPKQDEEHDNNRPSWPFGASAWRAEECDEVLRRVSAAKIS
jgi:hypothetical protein